MSRPTLLSKREQADLWMNETFGSSMRDHLAAQDADPISVAIVQVDKLFKKTNVDRYIAGWMSEDSKSPAGAKPHITRVGVLRLILLQIMVKRPTLITEMGDTYRQLTHTQRKILGLVHDGWDERIYHRLWEAVQGLMKLVDEYPGRRDKVLNKDEYRALIQGRDPVDCLKKRQRMFLLANALLEGSHQLTPEALRAMSDGNIAIDATYVPLAGKVGNPSPKFLDVDRRNANHDGGWYGRSGDHGALSHSDAAKMNKDGGTKEHKGTSMSKLAFGVEIEIARATANVGDAIDQFPLLTLGISFHRPGELVGEGFRLAQSLKARGHKTGFFIADRAYTNGLWDAYHAPISAMGFKHVMNYPKEVLGKQGHDPRGFVQVSGAWYLDNLPEVLITADWNFKDATEVRDAEFLRIKRSSQPRAEQKKDRNAADKILDTALRVFTQQQGQRAKYRLMPKGKMTADWSRRFLIPTGAPKYATWKAKSGSHQGTTVTMNAPTGAYATTSNPGGLKHEQHYPWGTAEWLKVNGMRNGVESFNRNFKRGYEENIADPDSRAVRGNTFTYLVVALAAVVENLRQIIGFYKRQLAMVPHTAKNKKVPTVFWQPDIEPAEVREAPIPPS